jgi:hypothetical protein
VNCQPGGCHARGCRPRRQAQYRGFGTAISDPAEPLRDVVDEILAISAQIPAIGMKKAHCLYRRVLWLISASVFEVVGVRLVQAIGIAARIAASLGAHRSGLLF